MADRFDVPVRLAEGREAVVHTQTYVSAAAARGYRHPYLTAHDAQVSDWYDGEDGMDLRLLDGDCADLWAAANAAEEALRLQRGQLGELTAAWSGPGADAAAGFLQRHCGAGAALTAGLRAAAEACETLRDELWRRIDGKVATAVAIDDRSSGQRPVWLAAAHAVGTGDTGAVDIIDHQVKPYVASDIGGDWVTAMLSARNAVAAAYETAAAAATPVGGVAFPIPGELGPRYRPEMTESIAPAPAAAPAAPATPVTAPPSAEPSPTPSARPANDPAPGLVDDAAALPADLGMPSELGLPGGVGLPGGGGGFGGLGGLIPRIADAIGGLLGSDSGIADPGPDEPYDEDAEADTETGPENDTDEVDDPGSKDQPDDGEVEEADEVAADAPADDAVDASTDRPPDPPPPAEPSPQGDAGERTPCEIAADELPQVGA